MAKLSNKQRAFVDAYLECLNATEAAARARYKGNRNTLRSVGSENLAKPAIAAEIRKHFEASAMTREEVLQRIGDMARNDISEFITDTGAIDWNAVREKGHLIKKIIHRKGQESQIELHDAQSALALLAKHHRLIGDASRVLNIDLSTLSVDQLTRLAAGEDLIDVLITASSESGTGAAQSPDSDAD